MSDAAFDRLNAALAGRYRIERELGVGGMATVYLADDLRHQRRVALKVLKPELAAVLGAERFLAEIRTTANLQHPNILPLFDSGEADGLLFYVMPYVDGESLRERIDRDGSVPVADTIRIASDVAEAIQAAHEQGVIHRDIKPANILLSRGRALVADFGIARAAEVIENERLTQTGSSIGTVGYMSPEQALGSDEVDHRSDIYSLACVVFEMLSGEPPFAGPTLLAVLSRQATEPVPSITLLDPTIPSSLERAITQALAKQAADRFLSAAAFAEALVAIDTEAPVKPRPVDAAAVEKSMVVLPFANRSGDPDNEYFSDGLTEEVISDLSRLSGLRVISRNSAMALKGTTKDTPTLARELGVTHLVTGSVRRAGQALRVTAELVEARTDTPLWSEKYSGTVEDVFGIQEQISREIVSALKVKLTDTEERNATERSVGDAVAYDCYLRARQTMYQWTREAQGQALDLLQQAIDIVGDSPLLFAMVGQIHWTRANADLAPADEALPVASDFVERSLAIDPEHHLAIFVRGLVAGLRGESEAALRDLYHANRLRPGDANILTEMCRYSNSSGLRNHWRYVEQCVRIDPLTPVTPLVVSSYRWLNGPRQEAAPAARRAIEMAPGASMLHMIGGWQIAEAGHREEGAAILAEAAGTLGAAGGFPRFLSAALRGDRGGVRHMTPDVEKMIQNEFTCRMAADAYALLGRNDDALRWLRIAIERGHIHYPSMSRDSDLIADLRGDPRFDELMAEVKPRWEAVVAWEATLPAEP